MKPFSPCPPLHDELVVVSAHWEDALFSSDGVIMRKEVEHRKGRRVGGFSKQVACEDYGILSRFVG